MFKKATKIKLKEGQYKSVASSRNGANLDVLAFNMGLIMDKHPMIAKKLFVIYRQLPIVDDNEQ